jgi:hypothetical protein
MVTTWCSHKILGTDLTGSTSVTFNATLATTFTVNHRPVISTTAPVGATSGAVQVITPGTACCFDQRALPGNAVTAARKCLRWPYVAEVRLGRQPHFGAREKFPYFARQG